MHSLPVGVRAHNINSHKEGSDTHTDKDNMRIKANSNNHVVVLDYRLINTENMKIF